MYEGGGVYVWSGMCVCMGGGGCVCVWTLSMAVEKNGNLQVVVFVLS